MDASSRLDALTELMRDLSSDMDPVRSINTYSRRLRAMYHTEGFMSISLRGAPEGHYRIVRLHHQDDVKRTGFEDIDYAGRDAPVHAGGWVGEVIARGRTFVTRDLQVDDDPVLGDRLRPYRMAMAFPVYFMGDAKNWVAFLHTQSDAFSDYEVEMKLLQANLMGGMTNAKIMLQELRASQESLHETVAELTAAQNRLVVQEKMAALGRLTAGIAHEIKNPLNFVNNFAEVSLELVDELDGLTDLMDGAGPLQEEVDQITNDLRDNVQRIVTHGKRAATIVESMLSHSRGKPGAFEPTDINALVNEYTDLGFHGMRAQCDGFACRIEKQFDDGLPTISVDAQSLSRAVLNVVNNALFAVGEKCKQRLPGYQPTVRITTESRSSCVVIRIWDNGIGIPKAFLGRIYEPFFTTKTAQAGTGLGLSLTHDIVVQQHGGTLEAESKEGEYTEFVMTVPSRDVSQLHDDGVGPS